jgi:hypothetical protein
LYASVRCVRKFRAEPKLSAEQIEHARKLIDKGESRQYVARGPCHALPCLPVEERRLYSLNMSLILTHINKFGVIHASDSNLTRGNDEAGQGQKTFRVMSLNAGLTVAGVYSVAGHPMDRWMTDFITKQRGGAESLGACASRLRDALETEMFWSEKKSGSMVHIAGYVGDSGDQHPEFYFVRNIYQITPTGDYADVREQFQVSEDFWTRDCPNGNLMEALESGGFQIYINGYPSGRIAYVGVINQLTDFFAQLWRNTEWKFRPPQSLTETALFVKLYMSIISTLFQVSNYPAPIIGGATQICEIPAPFLA